MTFSIDFYAAPPLMSKRAPQVYLLLGIVIGIFWCS